MFIDGRKIKILQAIIEDYVDTGEPVGSRTIAKKYNLGISSATIRNEMSDLEEMGFIEQIHSSSGRIPSNKGYRLYVDRFMEIPQISPQEELEMRNNLLNVDIFEIDSLIKNVTQILSDMTQLTCIVKTPSLNKSYLKHLQLNYIDNSSILVTIVTNTGLIKNALLNTQSEVDLDNLLKLNNFLNDKLKHKSVEDLSMNNIKKYNDEFKGDEVLLGNILEVLISMLKEIDATQYYLNGTTNIFNYQEYNDVQNAKKFLNMMNDKEKIKDLFNFDFDIEEQNINIKIGDEISLQDAEDCSIVSTAYSLNKRPLGVIGVIGPTRIHYSKVVSTLSELVKILDEYIEKNLDK